LTWVKSYYLYHKLVSMIPNFLLIQGAGKIRYNFETKP
jgi:hypothetical protein